MHYYKSFTCTSNFYFFFDTHNSCCPEWLSELNRNNTSPLLSRLHPSRKQMCGCVGGAGDFVTSHRAKRPFPRLVRASSWLLWTPTQDHVVKSDLLKRCILNQPRVFVSFTQMWQTTFPCCQTSPESQNSRSYSTHETAKISIFSELYC